RNVAAGRLFSEPSPEIRNVAESYVRWEAIARWSMLVAAVAVMMIALVIARSRLASRFPARHGFERTVTGLMIFCSVVAILTTLGIVASLVVEAWAFFEKVSPAEFFFGLNWEPQIALRADQVAGEGAFGAIPVFTGT